MEIFAAWYEAQIKGICHVCPRCGIAKMDVDPVRNASSRRAHVFVCDDCGRQEAVEDMSAYSNKEYKKKELSEWAINTPEMADYVVFLRTQLLKDSNT